MVNYSCKCRKVKGGRHGKHKKGKKRKCKFGVNKRTGRCLKHKRH